MGSKVGEETLLDEHNKNDFKNYMNNENSFHPHNMFICKTELIKNYYEEIFNWLEKCEKKFGFDNFKIVVSIKGFSFSKTSLI